MDKKSMAQIPIEETPEVKSFIYQQIVEFEPFLTPSSLVSVISKNDETPKNKKKADKIHRVLISIKENGVRLEEEGSSENIYEAILEAKSKLYQKLVSIQDSIISEKDRMAHIRHVQGGGSNIH